MPPNNRVCYMTEATLMRRSGAESLQTLEALELRGSERAGRILRLEGLDTLRALRSLECVDARQPPRGQRATSLRLCERYELSAVRFCGRKAVAASGAARPSGLLNSSRLVRRQK